MIFLDTSYLAALANPRDGLHARARKRTDELSGAFLTTEYVLVELVNLLSMPAARARAHALLTAVRGNPAIRVIEAGTSLLNAGLTMHRDRPDKSWSLTDCISFVVMREHGAAEALTADHHFEQAGFRVLLGPE